jgi:hypothetical protein
MCRFLTNSYKLQEARYRLPVTRSLTILNPVFCIPGNRQLETGNRFLKPKSLIPCNLNL